MSRHRALALLVVVVATGFVAVGVGCDGAAPDNAANANAGGRPDSPDPPPLTERQMLDQLRMLVGEWDLARYEPRGDHPVARRVVAADVFQACVFAEDGSFRCSTLLSFTDAEPPPATREELAELAHPGAVRRVTRDVIGTAVETVGMWTAVLEDRRLRLHLKFAEDGPEVVLDAVLHVPPRAEGRYVLRLSGNPVLLGEAVTEFARYE